MTRKPLLFLTPKAKERLEGKMHELGCLGLHIGVTKGGCAGMNYVFSYANHAEPTDETVEQDGVKIFLSRDSLMFLLGSTLDVEETKFSTAFVMRNPNQSDACGCGESFIFTPISDETYQKGVPGA